LKRQAHALGATDRDKALLLTREVLGLCFELVKLMEHSNQRMEQAFKDAEDNVGRSRNSDTVYDSSIQRLTVSPQLAKSAQRVAKLATKAMPLGKEIAIKFDFSTEEMESEVSEGSDRQPEPRMRPTDLDASS
jgi:hypothetical protein